MIPGSFSTTGNDDDDWLKPLAAVSHVDGNLWMGGCPNAGRGRHVDIGDEDAPPQFKHFVALWDGGRLPYRPRVYQTVTIARMLDCEYIPDHELLHSTVRIIEACCLMGPTLVHCHAGLNRSGLVVALVLIRRGMTPAGAINHLRACRDKAVLCNEHFERWLLSQGGEP